MNRKNRLYNYTIVYRFVFSSCGGSSLSGKYKPSDPTDANASTPAGNQDAGAGEDDVQMSDGTGLQFDEVSFSTPEDAVSHFVAAIAANDLYEAFAACGVNELAENYDAAASPPERKWINTFDAFSREYEFIRLNQVTSSIRLQLKSKI
jgi:hypothetical protein